MNGVVPQRHHGGSVLLSVALRAIASSTYHPMGEILSSHSLHQFLLFAFALFYVVCGSMLDELGLPSDELAMDIHGSNPIFPDQSTNLKRVILWNYAATELGGGFYSLPKYSVGAEGFPMKDIRLAESINISVLNYSIPQWRQLVHPPGMRRYANLHAAAVANIENGFVSGHGDYILTSDSSRIFNCGGCGGDMSGLGLKVSSSPVDGDQLFWNLPPMDYTGSYVLCLCLTFP